VSDQPPAGRWCLLGLAAGDAIDPFGLARLLADAARLMLGVWVTVLPGDVPCAPSVVLALAWGADTLLLVALGHLRVRGWTVHIRAP
jgi:hypothetical protein